METNKGINRRLGKTKEYEFARDHNRNPHISIEGVNTLSNSISHVVDFWLDSVSRGYITEFSIDYTQSYSVTKRKLFKGL